ncbi:MAG TPA: hypothetical protein DC003_01930 [Acholeplasmataceae bacterium]|nr:hypothetical protein [Acholeplasmataceae bacterium]
MIYYIIPFAAIFLLFKAIVYYMTKRLLIETFQGQYISNKEVVIGGKKYHVHFISCSKHDQIRINSFAFIEIITPKQNKHQLIPVNLKSHNIYITSNTTSNIRRVINENEEIFLACGEKVFQSYVMKREQLQTCKEQLI